MSMVDTNRLEQFGNDFLNNLSVVAKTGKYNDILERPTLSKVASSGSYNDLTNIPTIPSGAAASKGVTDSTSASAISTGTSLPTERDIYYGLPNINGSHSYNSNTNIYVPITAGTSGQVLTSNGSGAPIWKNNSSLNLEDVSSKLVIDSNYDYIKYINSKLLIKIGQMMFMHVNFSLKKDISTSYDTTFFGAFKINEPETYIGRDNNNKPLIGINSTKRIPISGSIYPTNHSSRAGEISFFIPKNTAFNEGDVLLLYGFYLIN